jgi:putative FmdB family regulatory protein
MPIYEYECQNCKFYTEVIQKISDAPLKKCPSCGKETLTKLISAPVFRLKGSGWYETDFKSDQEAKRNLAGADKEESKAAESTSSTESKTTTETKPAATPEPKRAAPASVSTGKSAARPAPAKPASKPATKPAAKPKAKAAKPKPKVKVAAKKARRR